MEGDVLVCADEQSAIDETIEIVNKMDNLRGLDCGSLANALLLKHSQLSSSNSTNYIKHVLLSAS